MKAKSPSIRTKGNNMKTNHIVLLAYIAFNLGSNDLFAQAPAQKPSNAQSASMMGMMNMSPEQCRDMMKKMGMSPAMMTRCQMMGSAQINAHDPAAVLALRSELGLTDAQVKDLEAIAAIMQDQVKAKLTAEQLAILAPIANTRVA